MKPSISFALLALGLMSPLSVKGGGLPAWTTYHEDIVESFKGESSKVIYKKVIYKIDVKSITSHGGWVFASSRVCGTRGCITEPFVIRAQCKLQKFVYGPMPFTRVNGDEWWSDGQIRNGTRRITKFRGKIISDEPTDLLFTAAFEFLCS